MLYGGNVHAVFRLIFNLFQANMDIFLSSGKKDRNSGNFLGKKKMGTWKTSSNVDPNRRSYVTYSGFSLVTSQ